ncbi:MAG: AAA family ATPase [Myxococcaceae bacterium]|nr:AAA family ATPase [Myxococcaceae bacterium]
MAEARLPEPLSITLMSVKQHRELTVDISGPMVVLVGPNGVGKSTVLKAIRAVGALDDQAAYGLAHWARVATSLGYQQPMDTLTGQALVRSWWGQQGVGAIEIGYGQGSRLHYSLAVDLNDTALMPPGRARLEARDQAVFNERTKDPHIRALKAVYLQPEFTALSKPSRVESTTLGERGENLASVIAEFALRFRKEHQAVLEALQRVVPEVAFIGAQTKSLIDPERGPNPFQAYELEFEFAGGARLRGVDVSEGTLISLAVLALAHHSPGTRIVLLDDIDRALHPAAQRSLVAQLRAVLQARPDLKIVCTSHSPYLVEHFEAHEVRVLGRSKKTGDTVCKRLDQHPEWERYKRYLDTGSYWMSVGEDWVGED